MGLQEEIDDMLAQLFMQARVQFGEEVQAYWFYEPEPCPGCGRKVDAMRVKGQEALSMNVFIYRERKVLIGYVLCSRCAKTIFLAVKRNPGKQIKLHTMIELNLAAAYNKHLNAMN